MVKISSKHLGAYQQRFIHIFLGKMIYSCDSEFKCITSSSNISNM